MGVGLFSEVVDKTGWIWIAYDVFFLFTPYISHSGTTGVH